MSRVAVLVAVAMALAACGGGGSDDGATSPTGEGAVTVEHRYGTTTIEGRPERIVSLDTQWTDVLVSLDAPLVGAGLDPQVETGRYPWQDVVPDDVEPITITDTNVPFEAITELRPDLIVITFYAQNESNYERLSQIAPTIPLLGEEEVDAWQDIAATAGRVLGVEQEVAALVDEADQRSADVLRELPGLDGRTYALANYVPGDALYVVADPEDGAGRFFSQLGLEIDPDLLAIADGEAGRATLSLERVDELDADLLVLFTNGADPEEIPGYDELPAVRAGAVAVLDLPAVTGLNTPTPLSIPYSLERIRPALDAAA